MGMSRWLDAVGIHDPRLRASYEFCGRFHRKRQTTMYVGTLLLAPTARPYLIALSAFGLSTDDVADTGDPALRSSRFTDWTEATAADLAAGHSVHPVRHALAHTVRTYDLPAERLSSMLIGWRGDIGVAGFATYAELRAHIHAITTEWALLSLPIVGLQASVEEAESAVRAVGEATQLTEYLDGLAEDLRNGRCYLPVEDLNRFGVTAQDLRAGRWSPGVADLLAFEVERARGLFDRAHEGLEAVHPSARPFLRAGMRLWSAFLDDLVDAGPAVLRGAARRRLGRRLRIACPAYLAARRAWQATPAPVPFPAPALP